MKPPQTSRELAKTIIEEYQYVSSDTGFLEADYEQISTLIDAWVQLRVAETANLQERTAQIAAHRACCGTEHDPANGKLHGYCVVCGVPWPCEYAGKPLAALAAAGKQVEPERMQPAGETNERNFGVKLERQGGE